MFCYGTKTPWCDFVEKNVNGLVHEDTRSLTKDFPWFPDKDHPLVFLRVAWCGFVEKRRNVNGLVYEGARSLTKTFLWFSGKRKSLRVASWGRTDYARRSTAFKPIFTRLKS